MKRQKRKNRNPRKTTYKQPANRVVDYQPESRRGFLKHARNGTLAAIILGGGGWYGVEKVKAGIREQDLTKIGNGTPTIVQIHDPQCPQCVALQCEARDALCNFEEGQLQFLVANIMSTEGRQLAATHGVGHVTLLLFDADGKRQNIIVGAHDSEYLTSAFRLHLSRYGSS